VAVIDQLITDRYALYNGDAVSALAKLPKECIHLSVYSPPFATEGGGALFSYSSSDLDLSNARTYAEFFEHYAFIVREIERLTLPGRMTVVHCMDVPSGNTGTDHYTDFPGDIIRLHEKCGFRMASPRITIWKEPLAVRNRTMTKALAHKSIVDDSCDCVVAGGDYLLIFRKNGVNPAPVTHEHGLVRYAGERKIPAELLHYRGWKGNQIENRYSHWIWRQYASCIWDDIRGNTGKRGVTGVLPFEAGREEDDERHLHPLQLDVIERVCVLWSNPGERVLSPFAGVGSEVYGAVRNGRFGIGVELKPSYFRQSIKNLANVKIIGEAADQTAMEFEEASEEEEEIASEVEV
jgi:DNA modification methylase